MAIDTSRGGPTFWRTQDNHRPPDKLDRACRSRLLLDRRDFVYASIQGSRHRLMHTYVVRSFNEIRIVPVTDEKMFKVLVTDARENRGIVNLIPVQMQDR